MVASLVLFFPLFEANGGGESNIHSRLYVQKLNLPPFAQKLFAFRLCVFVCLFALEVIVQTNCGWGAGDPSRPHLAHQKVAETSESQAEAGQKKKTRNLSPMPRRRLRSWHSSYKTNDKH